MKEFIKWIKNTFSANLPDDYYMFLTKGNFERTKKNIFNFYEDNKPTSSDVHFFLKPFGDDFEGIVWNYDNFLDEEMIEKDYLPIAQDSGGNLVCLCMSQEHYGKIYFFSHDSEDISALFVANSFSDWLDGLYEYK